MAREVNVKVGWATRRQVVCPHCKHKWAVNRRLAGWIRCESCRRPMRAR